ncbi:hypothetical protein NDU88_001958 [Pleurodeles waltl]|uniref:Secreted protein n=1 Tax=Pleurodeles waltl TaxID=8319 RepID=A0AAV7VDE1_PLEWA|nr:hypothetical protein NDU88_001958 [Pleurodeles waltl]
MVPNQLPYTIRLLIAFLDRSAHTGGMAKVALRPGPGGYATPCRQARYTQRNSIGDQSLVCGTAVVTPRLGTCTKFGSTIVHRSLTGRTST